MSFWWQRILWRVFLLFYPALVPRYLTVLEILRILNLRLRYTFNFIFLIPKNWIIIFPQPKIIPSYNIIYQDCRIPTIHLYDTFFTFSYHPEFIGKLKIRWNMTFHLYILCCLLLFEFVEICVFVWVFWIYQAPF